MSFGILRRASLAQDFRWRLTRRLNLDYPNILLLGNAGGQVLALSLSSLDCINLADVVKSDTPSTSFGYTYGFSGRPNLSICLKTGLGRLVAANKGITRHAGPKT